MSYRRDTFRQRLACRLAYLSDRIGPDGSVAVSSLSFTIEPGKGVSIHTDGRGCPVLFERDQYELAYLESDDALACKRAKSYRFHRWLERRFGGDDA